MATKREHAVAILDALDSKARLTSRTLVGSGIAAIFLLLIAYFTMWQYAAGGALLIALLLQMTHERLTVCLLYTSPSPRDRTRSRMPSSA